MREVVCAGCKNLDEKKKVDGAVSGTRYYCKKSKKYIDGSMNVCDKFEKSYIRDIDTYNKIYKEGKDWDNDAHSASFYLIIGVILLIILLIVYLCNPGLY